MGREDLGDQVLQDLTAISHQHLVTADSWGGSRPRGQLPASHLVTALTSEPPVGSDHGSTGQVASKEPACGQITTEFLSCKCR